MSTRAIPPQGLAARRKRLYVDAYTPAPALSGAPAPILWPVQRHDQLVTPSDSLKGGAAKEVVSPTRARIDDASGGRTDTILMRRLPLG